MTGTELYHTVGTEILKFLKTRRKEENDLLSCTGEKILIKYGDTSVHNQTPVKVITEILH